MARVALVIAAIFFVATAQADAARKVPRGWLGVTVDGPMSDHDGAEWDRVARSGAETVRAAFFWVLVQPNPPGSAGPAFDFASTDSIVLAAARRRLTVLPVVQWAPKWAAVQPGEFGSPPSDPSAVHAIFKAFVERYGPRGSLWREKPGVPRRPIRAWQVFNEPNLSLYWSVQPFERAYIATLRAAEGGIHAADPGATVVLAGLTNDSWNALRTLYAGGARGLFDAVAIHPYSSSPANVVRVVRDARRVMRANRDAALPIWVTEFSWPAAVSPPDWAVSLFGGRLTDAQQARLLNRTMRRFVAARKRLGIGRLLWYTWLSREAPGSTNPFDYAGLRRIQGDARRSAPALRVYRRWARRLEG
jgi:hypothetical protein